MKHLLIFIAFIGAISPVISQVKYTNPENNFSITFPIQPEYSSNTTEVEEEILTLHNYMATIDNTYIYMVSMVDYTSSTTMGSWSEIKEILQGSAGGFFGSLNISMQNEKEVKTGKVKGLQYDGNNGSYYLIYRVFLANGSLFQLAAMGINKETPKKQGDTFFKSFKILKK